MDVHEARDLVKQYTPEQIRYISARLMAQSSASASNIQSGVRLLCAVAMVWLEEKETCQVCGKEKPKGEMMAVQPICKECY